MWPKALCAWKSAMALANNRIQLYLNRKFTLHLVVTGHRYQFKVLTLKYKSTISISDLCPDVLRGVTVFSYPCYSTHFNGHKHVRTQA